MLHVVDYAGQSTNHYVSRVAANAVIDRNTAVGIAEKTVEPSYESALIILGAFSCARTEAVCRNYLVCCISSIVERRNDIQL